MLGKYRIIRLVFILFLLGLPLLPVSTIFAEDSAGSDLKTGSTAGYDLVVQNPLEAGSTGVASFEDGCPAESIVAEEATVVVASAISE